MTDKMTNKIVILLTDIVVNITISLTIIFVKNEEVRRCIMALLNRLKEYRARLGINQTELGKLAGVSRQTISLIEREITRRR